MSGRPKKRLPDGRTIAEAAIEHAELALKTLVAICQTGESEAARSSAANALLDRGFGKPTQMIAGDDEGAPITVRSIDMATAPDDVVAWIAKQGLSDGDSVTSH